jgi:hypothetical protein
MLDLKILTLTLQRLSLQIIGEESYLIAVTPRMTFFITVGRA